MSKVTVIGLGEMGAALAQTLFKNDFKVTVWNRTGKKAEKLKDEGAMAAKDIIEAIEASPLIITCVTNYEATREILSGENISAALEGKTLVEFSTGLPQEARDAERWAHERNLKYLDGAIAATPKLVGNFDTPIFISGERGVFEEVETALKTLGDVQFMGEAIGAAAAFDHAFLAYLWGTYLGFLNSASIFETENLPVTALGAMIEKISPVIGEMVNYDTELIEKNRFDNPQSTLEICLESAKMILRQSEEAGTNTEISKFTRDFFQKGVDAGYGRQGIASLIKLLRKKELKTSGINL